MKISTDLPSSNTYYCDDVHAIIYENLLESILVETAFEVHKRSKVGASALPLNNLHQASKTLNLSNKKMKLEESEADAVNQPVDGGDIYGNDPSSMEPKGAECLVCKRVFTGIALSTFARHLDKCMMIGNGSRISSNSNVGSRKL